MSYLNRKPDSRPAPSSSSPAFVPPPGKDLSLALPALSLVSEHSGEPNSGAESPSARTRAAVRRIESQPRPIMPGDAHAEMSGGMLTWPKQSPPGCSPSMTEATRISGDLFSSVRQHRRRHSEKATQKVSSRVSTLERQSSATTPRVPPIQVGGRSRSAMYKPPSNGKDSKDSQVVQSLIQARHVKKTIAKFAPLDGSGSPVIPPFKILTSSSSSSFLTMSLDPLKASTLSPSPSPSPTPSASSSSSQGGQTNQPTTFLTWSSPSEEEIELVQKLWSNGYVRQNVQSFQGVITKSLENDSLPPATHRKEIHSRPDGGCSYCGCLNFKANFFNPTFCSFCFHIHPPDSPVSLSPRSLDPHPTGFPNDISSPTPTTPRPGEEIPRKVYETLSAHVPNFSIERAKDQTDVVNMTTAFLLQAKTKTAPVRDIFSGGEKIRGELIGPNAINISPVVLDNEDGSYLVMFSTAVSGNYTLRLFIEDPETALSLPIGPAIDLCFLPGEITSERCFAVGKGVWGFSTKNVPESFSIISRDRFGNRRHPEDGDFSVHLSHTSELEGTLKLEKTVIDLSPEDAAHLPISPILSRSSAPVAASSSASSLPPSDLLSLPVYPSYVVKVSGIGEYCMTFVDNMCQVTYRLYHSSTYHIHILCSKDHQPIPGSPFPIDCSTELLSELFMPHEMEDFRSTATVDRRSSGLHRFPMEILQLTKLQRLYLSDNQLTMVPQGLCMLTELIELDLSRNDLTHIPPQIGELSRLESLLLSRNKLIRLPSEIGFLTKLTLLDVASNQLHELPYSFLRLRNLADLQLHGNPLTSPPLEVCELGINHIFDHFENMAPSVNAPFDVKLRWLLPQLRKFSTHDDGFTIIQVSNRESLFSESVFQLSQLSPTEIRRPLKVIFINEHAIDLGGPRREWFRSFCRAMVDQDLGLFESFDDGRTFQPHPLSGQLHPNSHLQYFRLFGRVVARAVLDKTPIDCHFTRSVYNSLLRREWQSELNSIDEFQLVNPSLYASMIKPLLMNDISTTPGFGDIYFSWESLWKTGLHSIFSLGKVDPSTLVTEENKWTFAQLFCRSRMYIAIHEQLQAFVSGFNDIVPRELISCFKPRELESLICGFERVDLQDLHGNTFIDVSPQIADPTTLVMWYWDTIHSFSQLDLSKLMQFVTGSSQVPVGGFARLKPMFTVEFQWIPESDPFLPLPTASTCFNTLRIPNYASPQQMYEKLRMAIHESSDYFGQC